MAEGLFLWAVTIGTVSVMSEYHMRCQAHLVCPVRFLEIEEGYEGEKHLECNKCNKEFHI